VTRLSHWYHVYADGNWAQPVTEHCQALCKGGLLDALEGWFVGFVGSDDNIAAARCTLDVLAPGYTVVAAAPVGWEQETLEPLWAWTQDHDGLVSYGHTKGSAHPNPINDPWRRCMEYHCFVEWRRPVEALTEGGASIAGSHWIKGGPSSVPGYGTGGMFGGNFWWTRAELLRQNPAPDRTSRMHAEHWLGQLSEVTPLTDATVCDLNTASIGRGCPDWV